MVWLWYLLAAAVLLVLVPYVIGCFLRDDYSGRVRVALGAPLSEVWQAVVDFERHPLSGRMARSVTALEDEEALAWMEDLGSTQLVVRATENELEKKLVLQVEDQVVPMTATWTFEFTSFEDEGVDSTELRASNDTVIRSGTWHSPVFRLVMRLTGGADKILREYIRSIAGRLEKTARLLDPEESI